MAQGSPRCPRATSGRPKGTPKGAKGSQRGPQRTVNERRRAPPREPKWQCISATLPLARRACVFDSRSFSLSGIPAGSSPFGWKTFRNSGCIWQGIDRFRKALTESQIFRRHRYPDILKMRCFSHETLCFDPTCHQTHAEETGPPPKAHAPGTPS